MSKVLNFVECDAKYHFKVNARICVFHIFGKQMSQMLNSDLESIWLSPYDMPLWPWVLLVLLKRPHTKGRTSLYSPWTKIMRLNILQQNYHLNNLLAKFIVFFGGRIDTKTCNGNFIWIFRLRNSQYNNRSLDICPVRSAHYVQKSTL